MRLPILSYGHRILKEKCKNISNEYPNIDKLITDMWETMQNAYGCGLAAPQIGRAIRLFIVDSQSTYENLDEKEKQVYYAKDDKGIMETFINAQIIERSHECWEDKEGCLSIPNLSYSVERPWRITIEYFNRNFEKQTRTFEGTTARMIQHEYDHTEGILYIDHLKSLTRKLMASKIKRITKGKIKPKYPMKFVG